ncbi:hypothetical protein LJC10_03215 [Selenomonadales bacterium OttesenSCG-928-I06]|nr:hypothetical protein [Selenomonadales bacterium OttesenSCG-928-I06]
MAEIYINKDDIDLIIQSFEDEDSSFVVRSILGDDSKKRCVFYLNGKECKIDIYLKKGPINILPVGNKNIDETNRLIDYIAQKGFSTNTETLQYTFPCTKNIVDSLEQYIKEDCIGIVRCEKAGNIYKFTGYNGDVVTFTFYEQTNNAMIQSKPFHAYSIVTTYLSTLPHYSFEDIVNLNNSFAGMNTPASAIRIQMQNTLGNVYNYLDEALLKSISGSLTLLRQQTSCEDYTGYLTGNFKALEGYLKKLLVQKYNYTLTRDSTFSMFHIDKATRTSPIDQNSEIPKKCISELKRLYSIYSNKRNVYLHATVDPSQTSIIPTLKEAISLSDEILKAISESYSIIFP